MIILQWRMTVPRDVSRRDVIGRVLDLRAEGIRYGVMPDEQTIIWQRPLHLAESGRPESLLGPRAGVPAIARFPVKLRESGSEGRMQHELRADVFAEEAIWFDAAVPTIDVFPVGFARFPTAVRCRDPLEPDREVVAEPPSDWQCLAGVNLAPATDPRAGGLLHGLARHLALVAWLDSVRGGGIGLEVADTTDYWSARDPDQLAQSMIDSLTRDARAIGQFKDERPGMVVADELLDRPDFERLEMGQMPALPADWKHQLADLIDLTQQPPEPGV